MIIRLSRLWYSTDSKEGLIDDYVTNKLLDFSIGVLDNEGNWLIYKGHSSTSTFTPYRQFDQGKLESSNQISSTPPDLMCITIWLDE